MRPFVKRAFVVLGLLLVVFLAALLVLDLVASRRLAAAKERFEAEVAPLEYAGLLRPALDSDSNAATWIQAGASALVLTPDQQEAAAELARSDGSRWSDEDRDRAAALVAAAKPAFDLLERALPLAESNFGIDYPAGMSAEVPDLMALLRVVRLTRLDGYLSVHEGDRERVLRDLAIIGRIGDALAEESLLVTALVTLSADRRYLSLLAEALPRLGPADLERIAAELERRDRHATLERALRADATLVARTPLAEVAREVRGGSGLLSQPAAWLTSGWYKKETALALDTFRHLIANLDRTVPESEVTASKSARGHLLVPNLEWATVVLRATEAARRLAASAVETRRAALERGRYAAEPLLVPGTDPDPFAGGAITFELRPDGSALLSAPGAGRLWTERDASPHRPPPPFAWELPPVAAAGMPPTE